MKKSLCTVAATLLMTTTASFACTSDGTKGIVEDNNLWISANSKSVYSVTKKDFNDVIDKVSAVYAPIVKKAGATLLIERKWNDGTVNAYAQRKGRTWMVSMFGGLARHEAITKDGFTLVVCHEIGHHLGGAPHKKSWFGHSWASNEGQADYWGTSKCMKKVFEQDDNIAMMQSVKIPNTISTKCSENFSNAEDVAICERGALAGLSLGNLFKVLRKLRGKLSFKTPDASQVSKTNDSHPKPQCRLDTYFQGSLCNVDPYLDVSETDANKNVCSRSNGDILGVRPLCWYKPVR